MGEAHNKSFNTLALLAQTHNLLCRLCLGLNISKKIQKKLHYSVCS